MKASIKKVLSSVWAVLKTRLVSFLKKEFVKIALKKILGSACKIAGFKVWLVTFIAKDLFDELLDPAIDFVIHEGEESADRLRGKFVNNRLDQAAAGGDNEAYDNAADDTFS